MTRAELPILKGELERELNELEKLRNEMSELLQCSAPTFVEIRAAGSILHDFYCGAEKIFKRIAARVDRDIPSGDDWHLQLLERMAFALPGLRPVVIRHDLKVRLAEFMRFRHLFRNLYGFELRWSRIEELGREMEEVMASLREDIEHFMIFLGSMQKSL